MTQSTTTRPRIVVMANNITELGGAQRIAHEVAHGLALRGYPVELIGIAPTASVHDYLAAPAHRATSLLDEPLPPISDAAARAAARTRAIARLRERLADGPPGLVITTQVWCMEHLAEAGYAGWRVIGQYHSSVEAAAAGRDLARLRSAYAGVDWFTLLTDDDARRFRSLGMPHAIAMPNPLPYWPETPAALAAHVLTYLGRLSAEKAPGIVLDAWRRIADRHPAWRLQLVGSGPLEEQVRDSAGERVSVLPPTADPQAVLLASGALALPSLVEGLPMAVLEAMACGLPVVAADCSSGVRTLVEDEVTGLLVTRGDAASMARALDRLLADANLRQRLGAAARVRVTPLRADAVLGQWERLIAATMR